MDIDYSKIKIYCLQCKKELGYISFNLYREKYAEIGWNEKSYSFKKKLFCDEKCFCEHKKKFEVNFYNGYYIYRFKNENGDFVYMPYWGCAYGFYSIEDCKSRMDNSEIGVYPRGLFKTIQNI